MKRTRHRLTALASLMLLAATAPAGVIYSGTDPDHIAAGQGRSYSASLWDVTVSHWNVGNVTLLDLPWTDKPFIAGAKHTLDYAGQQVNGTYEVRFGDDTFSGPYETVGIVEYHLKGTGGLFSKDDFFIAELDHWPTSATAIPLYLEGFALGQVGEFSGVGDVYIDNEGFAYFDGIRRTGRFVVDENPPIGEHGHVASEMFPLNFPSSDVADMGGAPGYSGTGLEMMRSDGEIGYAGTVNYVNGGFDLFGNTVALRMDENFAFAQSVTGYCADADGSQAVDLADFAIVQRMFGQLNAAFEDGDFDLDTDVDFDDFSILIDEMGTECP